MIFLSANQGNFGVIFLGVSLFMLAFLSLIVLLRRSVETENPIQSHMSSRLSKFCRVYDLAVWTGDYFLFIPEENNDQLYNRVATHLKAFAEVSGIDTPKMYSEVPDVKPAAILVRAKDPDSLYIVGHSTCGELQQFSNIKIRPLDYLYLLYPAQSY